MAKIKTYRIEAKADDKFKVAVTAGDRTIYVDQPEFAGGSGAGASPVDYLFSSLAGCIATTARIIATQRDINLNGMDMTVEGPLDLHVLYGKSDGERPGFSGITVNVSLDSNMSEPERKSFFEELQLRCPVFDTITKATPITITAA